MESRDDETKTANEIMGVAVRENMNFKEDYKGDEKKAPAEKK